VQQNHPARIQLAWQFHYLAGWLLSISGREAEVLSDSGRRPGRMAFGQIGLVHLPSIFITSPPKTAMIRCPYFTPPPPKILAVISHAVCGVKESLIVRFKPVDDPEKPWQLGLGGNALMSNMTSCQPRSEQCATTGPRTEPGSHHTTAADRLWRREQIPVSDSQVAVSQEVKGDWPATFIPKHPVAHSVDLRRSGWLFSGHTSLRHPG